ncbi:MAG: plasmid pRiA4b ORF-3 family protein [Leptolyngbya sp. LCM1.Bin17]|nr:MAG: plasmid pRiA4b ORF-3 family protein [Leptolyngbya sp. LCM1.Bin17]
MTSDALVYQLWVEIVDSEPPIWRRFTVPSQLSLADFHPVLAAVMGWAGQAPYQFKCQGQTLGPEAATRSLAHLLAHPNDDLLYTYNPAQGWLHKVTLEAIHPSSDGPEVQCLEGDRHCPPERCDGVWGYDELLERLNDGEDPEYDQLWQMIGYDFNPESFDLAAANQRLQQLGH